MGKDGYVFFYFILETYYWLGSTDVVNGDLRWIYDQTQLSYKNFYSGRPYPTSNSNSYTHNCIEIKYSNGLWRDFPCSNNVPYICESIFCKFYWLTIFSWSLDIRYFKITVFIYFYTIKICFTIFIFYKKTCKF